MVNADNGNVIDAWPTKKFFIDMLVKDIGLIRSIIDLIDNSVDGAMRITNGDFSGLQVRLELDPDEFTIVDNCGGISIEHARDYVFRFGRPDGFPETTHSIGQFGVGMKRSLFKLGRQFAIESTTQNSRFGIDVDVDEWEQSDDWKFEFDHTEELENVPLENTGTTITVQRLHSSVSDQFDSDLFISSLAEAIRSAHQENMNKGIAISLNGVPLSIDLLRFKQSKDLKPAFEEIRYKEDAGEEVIIRMYSGLSESDPQEAGWYVFCNGRLVLEADQSFTTGWGEGRETAIPKYHNQFARFRGYVFLDSDDAGLLPWNTTKTGVDEDSPIYRATRKKMIAQMRPVITFLNKLKEERDREETDVGPLEQAVESSPQVELRKVKTAPRFLAPKPKRVRPKPTTGRILYHKPKEQIERVQKELKVKTHKEVGELTFDYYYDLEIEQ